MFFLVSGAAASGKSILARRLNEVLPHVDCHDEDEICCSTETPINRFKIWMDRALEAQAEGRDFLLTSHTPFGRLLACPDAIKLNGISACLVDCHDYVRVKRYRNRPQFEEWPLIMDTLCWAAFHRMHAKEPKWEQRIVLDMEAGYDHDRWIHWENDDPRWDVNVFDTTTSSLNDTVKNLQEWVKKKKKMDNLLTPEKKWWIKQL